MLLIFKKIVKETGRNSVIRFAARNLSYKSKNLHLKLIHHSLDNDYTPNYSSILVIRSSCKIFRSWAFIEGLFTRYRIRGIMSLVRFNLNMQFFLT